MQKQVYILGIKVADLNSCLSFYITLKDFCKKIFNLNAT